MKSGATRPYRQTARAAAAEQTRRDILAAAVALWRKQDVEQVTLAEIAEEAGVTTQTVIRRFGSKDGVLDAVLKDKASGIEDLRDEAPVGDLDGILDVLLRHYERDGDAIVRMLAMEDRSKIARTIAAHGRLEHRTWCARVFEPYLPSPRARAHATRVDAFVAATDLYLWKLLRRDLGRSAAQTRAALAQLLEGLATTPAKRKRR